MNDIQQLASKCYRCLTNMAEEVGNSQQKGSNEGQNTSNTNMKIKGSSKYNGYKRRTECKTCGKSVLSGSHYLAHIDTHKDKFSRTHKCEFCDLTFSTPNALKVHKERQHGVLHFDCKFCKSRFTDPKEMKMHLKLHNGPNPYFCTICDKRFQSRIGLGCHIQRHNTPRHFECDICKKKFATKHHLDRHRDTHLNYKRLQCSICSTMFSQEKCLQIHVKNKHSSFVKERLYCDICGSSHPSFKDLLTHSMYHIGLRPFECRICKWKFTSSQNLHLHHRSHLVPEVQCDICLKTFVCITRLKKHLLTHKTREKQFACDLCNETFSEKQGLKRHKETHTGEIMRECPECGKFLHRDSLKRHLRIHLGIRPYKCDKCGRNFDTASHLKRHFQSQHIPKTKYRCEICKATFWDSYQLEKHYLRQRHLDLVKKLNKTVSAKNIAKMSSS